MLNMHLEPLPEGQTFCVDPGHILGQVHLSGNWKGRIEVRLTEGLALAATSAMLMQPLEEVGEADTLDAIREIANMVAGTIKSALPRPCSMTVPESAVASEGLCNLPTSDDTLAVAFSHESGSLMVRVWEEECAEPSAIEDTPE
jgi:CheY-specific phosphatase CheX